LDRLEKATVRGGGRGGFIGLEMAENLIHRGMDVTIIEMADQLMPRIDPEMAEYVRRHVAAHVRHIQLSDGVAGFKSSADGTLVVTTKSGAEFHAGLVVLAIGVRPESSLARTAGLEMGSRGGIRVDSQMRTSDPHIWAVGYAVEVRNRVTGPRSIRKIRTALTSLRWRFRWALRFPGDREIWINCAAGQRAYYACRMLNQNGFRVRNLSGGYQTYCARRLHERKEVCVS